MSCSERENHFWVVTIDDVVYGGLGLARVEGYVVFVPGVLPGEEVVVHPIQRRRRFARGIPHQLLSASPRRVPPGCPLFRRPTTEDQAAPHPCPGCAYQHVEYAEEIRLKQRQMEAMIRHAMGPESWTVASPVPSPHALAYRNKITLHVRPAPELKFGYLAENNRTVIDVPNCPLAVEPIQGLLAQVRGDRPFLLRLKDRTAVTFRHTSVDGAWWWVGYPSPDSPDLTEITVLGHLRVPRGAFFQVNPAVANLLLQAVDDQLATVAAEIVLDLYCGVGIFGLAAGRRGLRVVGVDTDRRAIEAAARNAQALGVRDARWIAAPVHRVIEEQLSRCPPERTLAIVDPPRTGLERTVCDALTRKGPHRLWYISCAVDTLARDLRVLTRHGYRLQEARLFDMFPRTPYFETFALLERKVG